MQPAYECQGCRCARFRATPKELFDTALARRWWCVVYRLASLAWRCVLG
jgi:hypothetical protein